MKKAYFNKNNIKEVSQRMLKKLESSHGIKIGFNVNNKTALIVTDMQNYFLDEKSHAFVPSAMAIVPKIQKLCLLFFEKNLSVIFTKHTNTKDNSGAMAFWWKDLIEDSLGASDIANNFDIEKATLLEKHQYDAFYETNLDEILKSKGTEQVIITGVLTHLCCESTARAAFIHGYKVIFPVDGTATYNIKYHKSTLRNLSHGFAVPVLMKELIKKAVEL